MSAEFTHTTVIAILLLSFLSVVSMLLGVVLAIYIGKNERAVSTGIGFSVGIMLLISFFELIPQALQEVDISMVSVALLLGILIVAALHWIIPHTHLVDEKGAFQQTLREAPIWWHLG